MWEFFKNPWLYGILFGMCLIAWPTLKGIIRRIPFLKPLANRKTLMMISIVGLLAFSGMLASMGFGSVSSQPSGMQIVDLQVTTDFSSNCTIAQDGSVDDLTHVRCTDAQVLDDASNVNYESGKGVITVIRTGDLEASSCQVVASTERGYESEKTPGDGSSYTITDITTTKELEVFLEGASSSTGATKSSMKEKTSIPFAEGVDKGYLGVQIDVDESGHDQLNQYSYKDVVVNICGRPYTFRIHRMD